MCLAIPGKIVKVQYNEDILFRSGTVSISGIKREVNLSMVPEAQLGDYVLIHVGVAISKIDEDEAQKTLELLKESGELGEV